MSKDVKRRNSCTGKTNTQKKFENEVKSGKRSAGRRDKGYKAAAKNQRGAENYNLTDEGDTQNDPSWYISNEQLLKAGASFPYGYPLGAPAYLDNDNYSHAGKLVVSGICAMDIVPSIGVSTSGASPTNVAARKIYSYIRHANSGASNYDAPDLMMYLMAMDSIYSMYWNGVRAYGTVMLYNKQNRYVPDALLTALGFDGDDLRANFAQLRYGLISLAMRINNLVVPNTMPLFDRHRWCFSHLWVDGTSPKSQMYFMRPLGYYVFTKDSNGAGMLDWKSLTYKTQSNSSTNAYTVKQYLQILESMIYPVLTNYDEDFGIISGDIMKAYDASQLYTLPIVAEDYSVVPEYDETVLSQFQNATLMGVPDTGSLDVTQVVTPNDVNAGALMFIPTWGSITKGTAGFANVVSTFTSSFNGVEYDARTMDRLVSLNKDEPTPTDSLEATRLTNVAIPVSGENTVTLKTSGTEIAIRCSIFRYTYSSTGARQLSIKDLVLNNHFAYKGSNLGLSLGTTPVSNPGLLSWSELFDIFSDFIRLSHFRFHPMMVLSQYTMTGTSTAVNGAVLLENADVSSVSNYFLYEIDNYTILSADDLDQLHEIATLGEFNI